MRTLSPSTYRRITLAAVVFVALIIVTGGAVRLSQSGLGCPTWPNCQAGNLTPHGAASIHKKIEFLNRLFTGLVSLSVIVAVLGSLLRAPRRRDLVWLSAGLVVGVVGQIVLGGVTVLYGLAPALVMSHFLLSMLILADAVVLHHRAGIPDGAAIGAVVPPSVTWLGRALVGLAALVVITGTVVTNTGPHAGDAKAKRFDLFLPDVARVHGSTVMVFLGTVLLTLYLAHRTGVLGRLQRGLSVLLVVLVAQAALGYIQYFTGVPAILVGFHIAGAALVWIATLAFFLGLRAPVTRPEAPAPDRSVLVTT